MLCRKPRRPERANERPLDSRCQKSPPSLLRLCWLWLPLSCGSTRAVAQWQDDVARVEGETGRKVLLPSEEPQDFSTVFTTVVDGNGYSVVVAHAGYNAVICSATAPCSDGELIRTLPDSKGNDVSISLIALDREQQSLTFEEAKAYWSTVQLVEGTPAW